MSLDQRITPFSLGEPEQQERSMRPRIGFWSPLPPQRSGIADYSFSLLRELAGAVDITVVTQNSFEFLRRPSAQPLVPEGVKLVKIRDVRGDPFDLNVYQMGNNATFHAYMHDRIIEHPGMLVLHDPSLVDFYSALSGGSQTPSFLEELRFDLRSQSEAPPQILVDGKPQIDRLAAPLCRRLVEASLRTAVHSDWAKRLILARSPEATVSHIYQPAELLERSPSDPSRDLTFGILGGVNHHKRVLQAIEAFSTFRASGRPGRLVIAGRVDVPSLVGEISDLVESAQISDCVEIRYDLPAADLDRALLDCDVLIALRWPTAGETSSLMMRALGAAMPVITTDVPQFREFDRTYCWLAPHDGANEQRVLLELMTRAADDPRSVAGAGQQAQRFVAKNATFPIVATRYQEEIESCLDGSLRAAPHGRATRMVAVNAIAYWSATTGIAEAARRAARAMSAAGVGVALTDYAIDVPTNPNRLSPEVARLSRGRPADIELCFLNVNELHGVGEDFLRSVPGRYLIAYWYWELPDLPERLVPEVRRFDEFWVASRFVKGNLARYTKAPILVMPSVVEPDEDPSLSRNDFGLPRDSTIFLMNFDVSSGVARKNPFGAIEAFNRAFGGREAGSTAHLVLKTMNLDRFPEADFEIRRRVDKVNGIVIDSEMTGSEIGSLTRLCDAFISLHRAEGFGLGLAEAMYFGLPVVATRYSGSDEFLAASNSCGVGYRLSTVEAGALRFNPGAEHLYRPGMFWAEPNIDQASRWMRMLLERPAVRHQIGQAAALTIKKKFSMAAAGQAMRHRLEAIESGHLAEPNETASVA